jgi:selenocysteine-specific translation elongation factor
MSEELIGIVNDFFARPVVAGISLNGSVRVGDKIQIKGHTTDIECLVESMQINHFSVEQALAGDSVGIKVPARVRKGDAVYKVAA